MMKSLLVKLRNWMLSTMKMKDKQKKLWWLLKILFQCFHESQKTWLGDFAIKQFLTLKSNLKALIMKKLQYMLHLITRLLVSQIISDPWSQ